MSAARARSETPTLGFAAAMLAAGLYLLALGNPFVYDDRITVVENPSIRRLSDVSAMLAFNLFRPFVNVSFAIDHALWGLNPVGFHLTNVALHAVNVMLVFVLLSRIVGDCRMADPRLARLIPFVTSVLFAAHPMMTEAVGYVSGRSDVLGGTFFLLAFLLMRRGVLTGQGRWMAIALVPFILGLLSKEVCIMLPFVLLAYDRLVARRSDPEGRARASRFHLLLIGGALVIGAVRGAVFVVAEYASASRGPGRMLGYLTVQFEVIWKYVQLLVLPVGQSIAHNVTGLIWISVLGAVSLVAVCIVAYRIREQFPLVSLGVAWFLLVLAPSSSAIPLQHAMAEHRVYLASVGFFLVVATVMARLAQKLCDRSGRRRSVPAYAAGVIIVGMTCLATMTVLRQMVWSDPVTLWREAAFTAPRWDTYTALGNALRDAGDCERALGAYTMASDIEPGRLIPLVGRWVCLTHLGRNEHAQAIVEQLRRTDPESKQLCQEIRALAPHLVSDQACIEEMRPIFGSARGA